MAGSAFSLALPYARRTAQPSCLDGRGGFTYIFGSGLPGYLDPRGCLLLEPAGSSLRQVSSLLPVQEREVPALIPQGLVRSCLAGKLDASFSCLDC
jgi:hypothetical protein